MIRVDRLLVDQGLAISRTQAQRFITEQRVTVCLVGQWRRVKKPSEKFSEASRFTVERDKSDRFVSRSGLKLAGALERSGLDVTGMTVIDVGQSTGGFTDCVLQLGAARVVGVEVGHNQLVDKLRNDDRVVCLEGMNARELSSYMLGYTPDGVGYDLAVMDVSFISQTKIIPSLAPLLRLEACLISLVKPQFEVGLSGLGKGGIVRDGNLYPKVRTVIETCCAQHRLIGEDYFASPIKGGDGNTEFLLIARKAEA